SAPSKLGWGGGFWKVFAPTLMAMIAFWSTLSLNMPDFTRFGGGQRQQVRGQLLGLPTTMSFIAIVAILTTSGGQLLYGDAIWDPAQLAARFSSAGTWAALVATALGAGLAVGGAYNGPFPADGLIPFLKPLYDYSWVVGLVASLLAFVVLSRPSPRREPAVAPEAAVA